MTPVEKALWLVETGSGETLTLDVFANAAGLSRFQMARAFRATTGVPLMAYVRGRRLSEAARRLRQGEPDILMVALAFGYGSHAAFTRAFSAHFGITPDEMRAGSDPNRDLMERVVMLDDDFELSEPVIKSRDAFRVAGLAKVYPIGPAGDIPALWQEFSGLMEDISGGYPGSAYGFCFDQADGESFEYVAAVRVAARVKVSAPLVIREIPAQEYAVFTHSGHISNIHKIYRSVYDSWLSQSGREHADGPDFEFYDERFNPATGMGEVEVWIPVAV